MIIRGRYNVYPREIKQTLYTHPDGVETAVVGIFIGEGGKDVRHPG